MRILLLGVVLAAAGAAAQAQSTANISCGGNPPGQYNSGGVPTINVSYTPGVDAGNPGLFWFGVMTPDQQFAEALDITNSWVQYLGGLYPPNQRFDGGIPGTISFSIPLPGSPTDTSGFVGYTIYAGHGVYTPSAINMVAMRRSSLNAVKPARVAAGTWQAAYDDDTQFQWSLIQKDMVDNNKWGALLTIPYVDCTIQNQDER